MKTKDDICETQATVSEPTRRRSLLDGGFHALAATLCCVSVVMSVGCGKRPPPPAARPNNAGEKNQVSQGGENFQWPAKMPADVPKFTFGTITGASDNIMGNVQAAYKNVPADAFDKYQSDLKGAGWTIANARQTPDGFEIDAAKGKRGVVAMFIASKNDGLKGAVTYNDHSG